MTLSTIIITYNNERTIERCLRMLLQATKNYQSELIIVDNNSHDKTCELVSEFFQDQSNNLKVDLIRNQENYGFAHAVNQGLKIINGKFILLLNPDAFIRLGAVELMLNFIDCHLKVGLVGPQFIFPNGQIQSSFGRLPNFRRAFFHLTKLEKIFPGGMYQAFNIWNKKNFFKNKKVDWLGGGCWLFKKELIKTVGYFDENFFLYLEDIDYCLRLTQAGYQIYYLPAAKVEHDLSHSLKDSSFKKKAMIIKKSWCYYWQKHFRERKLAGYLISVLIALKILIANLFKR